MGSHYLSNLFAPRSIAVFGASEKENAVGTVVFRNLLQASKSGDVYPINPKHTHVLRQACYQNLAQLGHSVDLAVIATPAETVPDIIEQCGKLRVAAALILSAGFREIGAKGEALEKQVLAAARRYGLRFIGPNCLGMIRPDAGLNATFYGGQPVVSGSLALVSQSGALCTAVLDWADSRNVGFSSVISTGIAADIDFGEILDYLVVDNLTESILMYVEGLHNARSFMSGLRMAARAKPTVVLKVGRYPQSSNALKSHSGALVGADEVFNAALARAGVVRVRQIADLFVAAMVLSIHRRVTGENLCIITNGGGPGVMACDAAVDCDLSLAQLSEQTLAQLDEILPTGWSKGNPVDLLGDATPQRYVEAIKICRQDQGVDNLLVILTPQAMSAPLAVANEICRHHQQSHKPLVVCWMGESQVAQARELFQRHGIPHFATPEVAVDAYSFLIQHFRNQKLLVQTPGSVAELKPADHEGARLIIESVLADGRFELNQLESKALLGAFHIPVTQSILTHSPNEALIAAEELGFPVVLKIDSPDITHKSDVGGVRINIQNAQTVRSTYQELLENIRKHRPNAIIQGVVVEPMTTSQNSRELMIGIVRDAVFGPVISFGFGGTMVEVVSDNAIALPPLNRFLIENLISKTHVSKMLGAFRHLPRINTEALYQILMRVSEMACELPWLRELDINPLMVDDNGAIAVDARVVVDFLPSLQKPYAHMAIHPYPKHLETHWQLSNGTDVLLRPIRPEDADIEQRFVRELSNQSRYFRFMHGIKELTPEMLARFTQIDYDREMALIAVISEKNKLAEIGVARYVTNPDGDSCEFAIVVSDHWQHSGIGHKLMELLICAARDRGLSRMVGNVLRENYNMLNLAEILGFKIDDHPDDKELKFVEKLL